MDASALTKLPYLWHNVPAKMSGKFLWPLKALGEVEPEVAAIAQAKYKGREHIANLHIPVLDCQWNEAIFLSPIHPQLVNNAIHEAGHQVYARPVYQLLLETLREHEAVWFDPKKSGKNGELLPESITPFDWNSYVSEGLSDRAMPYYRQCAAAGHQPLFLGRELHVLVRGFTRAGKAHPIDVSQAAIITTHIPATQIGTPA